MRDILRKMKPWQWILLAIPPVWYLLIIAIYGVDVIYWDSWAIVALYEGIQENGLSLAQMFVQHNEHRIFFPRFVILAVELLTGWNEKACMFTSAGIMFVSYALILKWCLSEYNKLSDSLRTLLCFLCGILLFNPVQWENTLWSFQVTFTMTVCIPVWSFYCAWRYDKTGKIGSLVWALVWAVVASFSSLQGLVVWPVYLVMLVLKRLTHEHIDRRKACLAAIVGVCTLALYIYDFHFVASHSFLMPQNLFIMGCFLAGNLGGFFHAVLHNFYATGALGVLIALFSLALFIYLLKRKRFKENWFPGCIVIFGYGVMFMTMIGRGGNLAIISRYQTFCLFILVGLLMIWGNELSDKIQPKKAKGVYANEKLAMLILSVFCLLAVLPHAAYLKPQGGSLPEIKAKQQTAQIVLKQYRRMSNAALTSYLYPWWSENSDAYRLIDPLATQGLHVFRTQEKRVVPVEAPYIITGLHMYEDALTVEGIVNDTNFRNVFRLAALEYKGELYVSTPLRINIGSNPSVAFSITIPDYDASISDMTLKVLTYQNGEIYSMPVSVGVSAMSTELGAVSLQPDEALIYNIETVGNAVVDPYARMIRMEQGKDIMLNGWCVNATRKCLFEQVYILLDTQAYALYPYSRPDVAVAFDTPV